MLNDQDKILEEALQVVKVQSFQMKRCLDKNKVMDALKHASNILCELRTSLLSPKYYYELYMSVVNELSHLQMFLCDEFERGNRMTDLYELVQYAGNIIPRLYLLITVGVVFIKFKISAKKDILSDLVEMCRGVQHPLRGLFLRNYFLHCTKNLFIESNGAFEEAEIGADANSNPDENLTEAQQNTRKQLHSHQQNLQISLDFILLNFTEMNKLWVRMQHQGHSKDRSRREKEREELKVLVGTNLVRISALEGVTVDVYCSVILPRIFEQVVMCKDGIAQEYLMECVIQVFPDEFHLRSLNLFLECCGKLAPQVTLKRIIGSLIERFSQYASRKDAAGIPADLDLFHIFSAQIRLLTSARPDMPAPHVVSLQCSLVHLGLQCYPERFREYVGQGLENIYGYFSGVAVSNVDVQAAACVKELMKLVKIPVDHPAVSEGDLKGLFGLKSFTLVLLLFGYESRKSLAIYIAEAFLLKRQLISTPNEVAALFEILSPLIRDQEDQTTPTEQFELETVMLEQGIISRILHSIQNPLCDVQYQNLCVARKYFGCGGEIRIQFTLPTLICRAVQLAFEYFQQASLSADQIAAGRGEASHDGEGEAGVGGSDEGQADSARILESVSSSLSSLAVSSDDSEPQSWVKKVHKIFQFCHQTITALAKAGYSEISFRLFLQCAQTANQCGLKKTLQNPNHSPSTQPPSHHQPLSDSVEEEQCFYSLYGFQSICYEFLTQAFLIYEDEISDSKSQLAAITLLIGTLEKIHCLDRENFDTLCTKCALYSSKLLKKPDRCRSVSLCAHLFWSGAFVSSSSPSSFSRETLSRDGKRVLECLQKSLKIADSCVEISENVLLVIEILNRYIYFFEKRNEHITGKYIVGLVDLIQTNIVNIPKESEDHQPIWNLYKKTLAFLADSKSKHPQLYQDVSFQSIK